MGAIFTDKKAGFEMVHGLLDRVMQTLSVPFLQSSDSKGDYGYYISQSDGVSLSFSHKELTLI
jgi:phenylalanyl-tRNA synthetase beta chain